MQQSKSFQVIKLRKISYNTEALCKAVLAACLLLDIQIKRVDAEGDFMIQDRMTVVKC